MLDRVATTRLFMRVPDPGLGLGLGLLPAFQSNVTLRRTVCSLSHFNEILPDFSDCSDEAVLLLSLALET